MGYSDLLRRYYWSICFSGGGFSLDLQVEAISEVCERVCPRLGNAG